MNKEQVKQVWEEVFGEHMLSPSKACLSDYYFYKGYVAKSPNEFPYGISHNDPMNYHFSIDEDGTYSELATAVSVKPEEGSTNYCQYAKIRKQTIKQVNEEKLKKRFEKVKKLLDDNKDRLK